MVSLIDASNLILPRVYHKPLRPVILLFSCLSFVWALVFGIKFLQDRSSPSDSNRMKSFDIAVSFFVVAVIELFGIAASSTQKISWTKLYFNLSVFVGILMSCTQLMMFIAHFVLKDDLIKECRSDLTGARAETLSGSITSIDAAQAVSLCEQDWQRGTWWDLG
ncbi:hypothetical protein BY996DRAFT_181703 [Phakopsora pachyrhizi]|nr:hypothetical protein BY996DRAFT_181703 [Phakopsora pachyrhizi]